MAGSLLSLLTATCGSTAQAAPLTWQAINQGLRPHASITTIIGNPENPRQLFAGLYSHEALYSSVDGGESWQRAGDAAVPQAVFSLLFDPFDPDILWIGSADGLYVTTPDAIFEGRPWQRVVGWPPAHAVYTLHAAADGTLYAGGADPSPWRKDEAQGWQPLAPLDEEPLAILSLTVSGDRLLAGTDGAGLFTSDDGGQSWQRVNSIGDTFVAALWNAPWDDELILARTRAGLFRSMNGAESWQIVGADLPARVDTIAGVPAEEAISLGLSNGEIRRSQDQGITWQRLGVGIGRPGMFHRLHWVDETSTFWAGTQSGLYTSQDQGP
jgi:photosystem II stability/assembly factor-like uncharacterized protein